MMTKATYFSGILQTKAYRILQHNVSREIKKFGINPTQWFILGLIKESGEVKAADIANLLIVEAPLITNLSEDLVSKKLIKKVNSSGDGRVKLLRLTERGETMVPKIEGILQANLKKLLEGVDNNDLKAYENVLKVIVKNG